MHSTTRTYETRQPLIWRLASTPAPVQSQAPQWPAPLEPEAYQGPLGDLVLKVEAHTEADPAAMLIQAVVLFGNSLGHEPHFFAEGARHALNLYTIIVGLTSKGRKGTALARVRRPLADVDPELTTPDRVRSGLSSGEGLIDVLDKRKADKRLVIIESEFASVLRNFERHGNTLSPVLRSAWDSGNLSSLTKQSNLTVSDAHLSVIGHITKDEFKRSLNITEIGNGLVNRFVIICATRARILPEGGDVPVDLMPEIRNLSGALNYAHGLTSKVLRRTDAAKILWADVYKDLSEGRPGVIGAVLSRAEAQVMRLAGIYALASTSYEIDVEHLQAALALWKYASASAEFIFGKALGHPVADRIVSALEAAMPHGLSRTEISKLFSNNKDKQAIDEGLTLLKEYGRAREDVTKGVTGRSLETWYAIV